MATQQDKRLIREDIRQYLSLLEKQNIHIFQAYLFGSSIKGTADQWSDIDLAIVTDAFIGDHFDFRFMLTKLARTINADIEPHPYLLTDFNDTNPAAGDILKHGERVL